MDGSPLAEGGHEAPPERGRVVSFPTSTRLAMRAPRRRPRIVPGVLIRLDDRRISNRRPGWFTKIQRFLVGSGATMLLRFVVKRGLPGAHDAGGGRDVKHEPETNTDAGAPARGNEFPAAADAEHRS